MTIIIKFSKLGKIDIKYIYFQFPDLCQHMKNIFLIVANRQPWRVHHVINRVSRQYIMLDPVFLNVPLCTSNGLSVRLTSCVYPHGIYHKVIVPQCTCLLMQVRPLLFMSLCVYMTSPFVHPSEYMFLHVYSRDMHKPHIFANTLADLVSRNIWSGLTQCQCSRCQLSKKGISLVDLMINATIQFATNTTRLNNKRGETLPNPTTDSSSLN